MIEQEHCFQVSGEMNGGTVGEQIVEEILPVARKPMQVGAEIQQPPSREFCPVSWRQTTGFHFLKVLYPIFSKGIFGDI